MVAGNKPRSPARPLQVLEVEDSPTHARLVEGLLSQTPRSDFICRVQPTLRQGLAEFDRRGADVVLLDLDLPDAKGMEALDAFRAHAPTVPIIVLTGDQNPGAAVLAAARGAQEFLVKNRVDGQALQALIRRVVNESTARQSMSHTEQQMRVLVEGIHDYGVIMLGPDGRVLSWNAGAQRILGYAEAEIVGQPYSCFFPEPDRAAGKPELALRVAEATGRFESEGLRVRKDGSIFWVDAVISPLYDPSGHLTGFSKITRDVTDRKAAEAERANIIQRDIEIKALREKAAFKDQFINNAAHELKTPMTPLRLQMYMLRRNAAGLSPEQQGHLEIMERSLARLQSLVQDVLQAARTQSGHLALRREPLDLNFVVAEAIEAFGPIAESSGIRLEMSAGPRLPVIGDAARLLQVVSNLLSNAIKYTPTGGRVTVTGRIREGECNLSVQDTGVGLSRDQLQRLFQPFSQVHAGLATARPGTGLGLFIAKGTVEQMGGTLTCLSGGQNQGSIFTLALPTTNTPIPEKQPVRAPAAPSAQSWNRLRELL